MKSLLRLGRKTADLIGRESRLIRAVRPIYEFLLAVITSGRGIPWTINGVEYRIDPRYRRQLGPNYDEPVAEFIAGRVRPGSTFMDVGANVGVYVLQYGKWSEPNGNIFAFEPNPVARKVLARHVSMNGLEGRVTIVPDAVGDSTGTATLHAAGGDGRSRLGVPNIALKGRTHEVSVTTTTLDEFCRANGVRPDWILIDIEGFEIGALAGARETIASGRPDLGIVVEMHPSVWPDSGTNRDAAATLLGALGLHPVPLAGQDDPLGEHGLVFLKYA